LRSGDFRQLLVSASGHEPSVARAQVIVALTSTWWRNAWKYQARAYRHAFWDSGTILANLLAVACGRSLPARVVMGFVDRDVNRLLDVDPTHEATICLVALGAGSSSAVTSPEVVPLNLPTRQLSPRQVAYPAIVEAHAASSLASEAEVVAWREDHPVTAEEPRQAADASGDSVETVILRRGSSRRFTREPITRDQLALMLQATTSPTVLDAGVGTQPYLIVNAVESLPSGAYAYNRATRALELLKAGDFRGEATFLDLGQELAGDGALNVYWLANLDTLDNRGYRAAQLEAAIEGGKLYLAAYSLGLGATGLTFFDDDVTRFFSPHAAGLSVMFLTAVGWPRRNPRGGSKGVLP
jgi:nitroreductase